MLLTRDAATAHLRERHGIPCGKTALADAAHRGDGPKYTVLLGRALYRQEDLDAWVNQRIEQAPRRKRA